MHTDTRSSSNVACTVNRLVPYAHVTDVEASLAFYALLGFAAQRTMKDAHGRAFWALAQSEQAQIMFARADGPIDPEQQAVLFYMYSTDVAALRQRLLQGGLRDGTSHGAGSNEVRRVVYDVAHRDYMPGGELRIGDPDGYVILVGQLE